MSKALSTPTISRLRQEYFHAADIRAVPKRVKDREQYTNEVITLRAESRSKFVSKTPNTLNRGYFVYGVDEGRETVFQVYSPYPSVKAKFPPRSLEVEIGLFTLRLIENGYRINPNSVEYKTTIEAR